MDDERLKDLFGEFGNVSELNFYIHILLVLDNILKINETSWYLNFVVNLD